MTESEIPGARGRDPDFGLRDFSEDAARTFEAVRGGGPAVIWPNNRDVMTLSTIYDRACGVIAVEFQTFRDAAYSQARLRGKRMVSFKGELPCHRPWCAIQFVSCCAPLRSVRMKKERNRSDAEAFARRFTIVKRMRSFYQPTGDAA